MIQQFINRKFELKVLEERYKSKKPEFLILYGRRRVGKTELVLNFMKNKPSIYFLSEEKRDEENREDMQKIMGNFLKDEEFKLIKFENWSDLFKGFLKRIKRRTIIIIDEFPYLMKENPSITSEFQKIWDMHVKSNVILILIGSSISMMEKLLGVKSPLYGRRTGQIEIKPISIFEVKKFLPKYTTEDCINVYGCVDGIPLYLNQFDGKKTFYDNIRDVFLRRDKMLYSEAEILLKQEFREPANYFSILKAISFGYTRHGEIADYTGIDKTAVTKYIQNLEKVRIVRKEYPVTEKKEKRKSARYSFTDNYFKFWFRFIYPNKTSIEMENYRSVLNTIKENYSTYMGQPFEKACKEFLWRKKPFSFTECGRWWHKDKEIDLVALGKEKTGFFECKWKRLSTRDAKRILKKLEEKSDSFKGNKVFGLIAKNIEDKEKLRNEGYYAFDLRDL